MTIEFWPRRHLTPRPEPKPKPATKAKKRTWRKPKLPLKVGKAQQMLSSAIILGHHEMAAWLYRVTMDCQVTGKSHAVREFQKRLDVVMAPADSAV